jgi:hypothetical protein
MVKQSTPISLRVHAIEVNNRARQLLRKLDEDNRLQRRVRWQALKAIIALREMRNVAAPKLRAMSPSDRDCWQAEYEFVETILLKISKSGVG